MTNGISANLAVNRTDAHGVEVRPPTPLTGYIATSVICNDYTANYVEIRAQLIFANYGEWTGDLAMRLPVAECCSK